MSGLSSRMPQGLGSSPLAGSLSLRVVSRLRSLLLLMRWTGLSLLTMLPMISCTAPWIRDSPDMFTIPVTSGGLGTWRPTASSGTGFPFTNPDYAYDLPSSLPDDPPYTTAGDSGFITSTSGAGVVQYNTAEFNTFKQGLATSLSKSNFSQCQLKIGVSVNQIAVAIGFTGTGPFVNTYVTANIAVQYQVDGTNWVTIKNYPGRNSLEDLLSPSAAAASSSMAFHQLIPSDVISSVTKDTISVTIPSSAFSSNLNNLKIRFYVGTMKDATGTYSGTASYQVWDIRANIS